jgi:hypothetical protein
MSKPARLMNLKVKTNGWHNYSLKKPANYSKSAF